LKRQIIGFILLFLWILQSTCALFIYKIERNQCYHEFISKFKNQIPVDKVQTFVFEEEKSIQWERKYAELEIRDEVFDVISLQQKGKNIIVRCVADKNEDALISHFKSLNSEKNKESKGSSFFKKLLNVKCLCSEEFSIQISFLYSEPSFGVYSNDEVTRSTKIQLPPPKC
jgi:hypothetical protein